MQNITDHKEGPEMEGLQYMNLCRVWSVEMIINSFDPTRHLPELPNGPEPDIYLKHLKIQEKRGNSRFRELP